MKESIDVYDLVERKRKRGETFVPCVSLYATALSTTMANTIFSLVDLVYCAMASEEDEVRALLMRHRKQIIRDINESELVTVLTQKGVLSATNLKQLNELQSDKYNKFGLNNGTTPIIKNLTDTANGLTMNGGSVCEIIKSNFDNESESDEKKCTFLIDVIARNGFEKFKEFCYAIERECPKLIEDLIADRLSGGKLLICLSIVSCLC